MCDDTRQKTVLIFLPIPRDAEHSSYIPSGASISRERVQGPKELPTLPIAEMLNRL